MRLGSFVLTITILCNRFGTELLRIEPVAVGLVPGYLVSIPLGQVDFAAVAQAGWVTVPRPLYFGLDFSWALLLPRILAYLITSIETSGDLADAAGSAAATLFNPMPNTTFNRNIGVISITKMGSRVVGYVAAGILLLLEFVPKIGALVIVTPNAVLGGATLALFAMVAISGIKIIAKDGLIDRKLFIMSIALNFGLAINYRPDIVDHMPPLLATVLSLGIAVGALLAIFLNLILSGRTAPTDA